MKKNIINFIVGTFCLVLLGGCASINIPEYIPDRHPYKKIFYSRFDTVSDVTKHTLKELGWKITKETDPTIYERSRVLTDPYAQQILIFTNTRRTFGSLGRKYTRINIFITQASEQTTEVELRFIMTKSIPFKDFLNFRADQQANQLFNLIESKLQ